MFFKKREKGIHLACLAAVVLIFAQGAVFGAEETVEEMLKRPPKAPQFNSRDLDLNRRVVNFICQYHYTPGKIDAQRSSVWFNEYFRSLDYTRMYFLESDIEDFRSYETILGDGTNLRRRVDFAFKVYERLLERMQQWAVYSVEAVYAEHDFSLSESIRTDYKEMPWCKTKEEQKDLWRRRVKNALLADQLGEEKNAEEAKKKAEKGEETETKDIHLLPPKDRLAQSYARAYKRRLDVESIEVMEIFLSSLTKTYDPHSVYMAPETKENFDIDLSLSLQGIGATLSTKDSYVVVVSIVPGGPADRDGRLKEGDRIIAVAQDGAEPVDVVDMKLGKVVSQIRGKSGTKVHLTILEEGSNTPKQITIVRDKVELKEAEAQSEVKTIKLENGKDAQVLVIYLPSFYADFGARNNGDKDYKSSSRDVRKLLEKGVKNGGIDGVVLDFRGNGGGSLDDAVSLAGLFFKEGPVVQIRDQQGGVKRLMDRDKDVVYEGPLMVMVDHFSASASEIVAAALQDSGRALLVGDKTTHGKGTVQNAYDLDRSFGMRRISQDGGFGSLKMTIAKFYRINGQSTQVRGVTPDITFRSFADCMETREETLPYVLKWDEIEPTKYPTFTEVASLKDDLRQKSEARVAAAADFQEYFNDIDFYKQLREKKEVSLNKSERKAFMASEEKASKMVQKFQAQRKNSRKQSRQSKKKEEKIEDAHDLILDETLRIMGDYLMKVQK
ncbi:MAG: carboxy terminal-processing peptidase [Lentisphaeria bacterium]|nr:carboxy terminal-processing peptidase [Lentisphaeria bacterium]